MFRVVQVAIPEEAAAQLAELARHEFRAPKQQAALLLTDAIERAARALPLPGRASASGRRP